MPDSFISSVSPSVQSISELHHHFVNERGREGGMGSIIPIHFSWQWNPHSNIAADGDFCPPCNKNIYSFYFTFPCENEYHSQVLRLKKLLPLTLFCNINEPRVFEIKFQMTFRVFWIDPYKVDSLYQH